MRDKFWACWDLKIAITAQVHYTHNYPYWDCGPWDCCSEWGKYYKASVSYAICIPLSNWTYFKPTSLSFSPLHPSPPNPNFFSADYIWLNGSNILLPTWGYLEGGMHFWPLSSSYKSPAPILQCWLVTMCPPPLNSQVLLVSLDPISPRDVENWELHWRGVPAS
jgi:hypothetical protein